MIVAIFIGIGIVLGMYLASQIENHISKNTNKIEKNIEEYDRKNQDNTLENNTQYYTYIPKKEKQSK